MNLARLGAPHSAKHRGTRPSEPLTDGARMLPLFWPLFHTGDTCRYSSCNDGYELSSFGSTSRECDWTDTNYREVDWDGSAKTCESTLPSLRRRAPTPFRTPPPDAPPWPLFQTWTSAPPARTNACRRRSAWMPTPAAAPTTIVSAPLALSTPMASAVIVRCHDKRASARDSIPPCPRHPHPNLLSADLFYNRHGRTGDHHDVHHLHHHRPLCQLVFQIRGMLRGSLRLLFPLPSPQLKLPTLLPGLHCSVAA